MSSMIPGRATARRWLLSLLPALAAIAPMAYAQSYRFDFLSAEGGLYDSGSGINAAGQVVGTVGYRHQPNAVLWSGGGLTYLPGTSLCCEYVATSAAGINNRGQVAGTDTFRAVLWTDNQPTLLSPGAGVPSQALSLNDSGQVVGVAGNRATLWSGGTATDLGTLGGSSSYAYDINNSGLVVGSSQGAGGSYLATVWSDGSAVALGSVGGATTPGEARAVNDAGVIVGYGADRAMVWEGGSASFLGGQGSRAEDINSRGWVVGSARDEFDIEYSHATLWRAGAAIDLNSFLSLADRQAGWVLEYATAINDAGWITGSAFNTQTAIRSAYLLTSVPAVPEGSSLALMIVGLGLLGVARKRLIHQVCPGGIEH